VAGDRPGADDGELDAVVVSGVLCPVSDVPVALAELGRVLQPGGQLRFYEHVRSRDAWLARFQRQTRAAIGRVFTMGLQLGRKRDCRAGQRREGVLITARRPAHWLCAVVSNAPHTWLFCAALRSVCQCRRQVAVAALELRAAVAASSPARSPLASEPSDSQPSGPTQSPARNRPGAPGTATGGRPASPC
jgi:SAM-dependent methyltransferase